MCGISGRFSFNKSVSISEIDSMIQSLHHRGPDGEGIWINNNKSLGLGHKRLSILDLSKDGAQPMHYLDRYSITFNGEIYNYLEIRDVLIGKGYIFKTKTDTEVILHAYQEYGKQCLNHFDGMFAFAIWDAKKQELFVARDRFGEKPFYFHHDKKAFSFASEMKALFAVGIPKITNRKMIYYNLVYDVIENPLDKFETFFENIYALPASHSATISADGKFTLNKYYDISINKLDISEKEAKNTFINLFEESVQKRMRSDVKLGSSLSGGVDSSSIIGMVKRIDPCSNFNTFTARFKDENFDEGHFIETLRNQHQFKSHYTYPEDRDITIDLNKLCYHQEEPFGTTSILAQWEVMKLARKNNTLVLLDGQGADETMAGYQKYYEPYLAELFKSDKSKFKQELIAVQKFTSSSFVEKNFKLKVQFAGAINSIAKATRVKRLRKLHPHLNQDFLNEFINEPNPFERFLSLENALKYDIFQYGLGKLLRFSDRNAMAHSVEVRLPYLSHKLVEFNLNLPSNFHLKEGWTKYNLRNSMDGIIPSEITWRKDKKGFQAPDSWLSRESTKSIMRLGETRLINQGILRKNGQPTFKQLLLSKL